MTEANLEWVWAGFPYDQWSYDEVNGWVNPEDDPATPTETILIEQIEDLHGEIIKLQIAQRRVENENIALATANSELRSDVRELKALLRSVTHD